MQDLAQLSPTSALSRAAEDFGAFVQMHGSARAHAQLADLTGALLRHPCKHCGRPLFECLTKQDAGSRPALQLLHVVFGKQSVDAGVDSGAGNDAVNSPATRDAVGESVAGTPGNARAKSPNKKGKAVKVQSKGETFTVDWSGPLDSFGNPKGRGTLYWEEIKFTGVWGTAVEDSFGYPIDPPKFLSRTDSASLVPDLAEFPDGSVFQGVLGAWPQQGILLCKGTGTLTLKSGHYVKGKWVSQGTVYRDSNGERIDRSLWRWAD